MKMKHVIAAALLTNVLVACSDSKDKAVDSGSASAFPTLPSSSSESVTLNGSMSFWMYEGAAGCYGTLVSGSQEIGLWASEAACANREYAESEPASVEVTFNKDDQFGPGTTYTITRFMQASR